MKDSSRPLNSVHTSQESRVHRSRESSVREMMETFVLSHHTLLDIKFRDDGDGIVHWLRTPGASFRDPFFRMTTNRIFARARGRLLMETGVDALFRQGARARLYPAGFIYHVSRCGSTVLSNMLNVVADHFVLAEPTPLGALFQRSTLFADEQWVELIRASINSLSAHAPSSARHFFLKFSHVMTHQVPLIRSAFPSVREIFVYRDPIEVVVSLVSNDPLPWIWSESLSGIPRMRAMEMPVTELTSRIVGAMLKAMCEHVSEHTLLINYSQLGPSTPGMLLRHFGITPTDSIIAKMVSGLSHYSKDPTHSRSFIADSSKKRELASAAICLSVEDHAADAYRRLEAIRIGRDAKNAGPPRQHSDQILIRKRLCG